MDANKKEIVKMLLKQELDTKSEEEMMEILFDSPVSINVEKAEEKDLSFGDKLADKLTAVAGSWRFIIFFVLFLIIWMLINVCMLYKAVDPYPFILLNLVLSCVAALQAPIIMMSQNRQSKKDSLRNQNDYMIDLKSELIIEQLHHQLNQMQKIQNRILKIIDPDYEEIPPKQEFKDRVARSEIEELKKAKKL